MKYRLKKDIIVEGQRIKAGSIIQLDESETIRRQLKKTYVTTNQIDNSEFEWIDSITNSNDVSDFMTRLYIYIRDNDEDIISISYQSHYFEEIHSLIIKYKQNPKIFPIRNLDMNNMNFKSLESTLGKITLENLHDILDTRNKIITSLRNINSIALNNLSIKNNEIDIWSAKVIRSSLNLMIDKYKNKIEQISDANILKSFNNHVFQPNYNISGAIEIIKNYAIEPDTINRTYLKTQLTQCTNTEIIANNNSHTILKVGSFHDMKLLQCFTEWCVSLNKEHWSNYSEKYGYLIQIFNWNIEGFDRVFLIGEPILLNEELDLGFINSESGSFQNLDNKAIDKKLFTDIWNNSIIPSLTDVELDKIFNDRLLNMKAGDINDKLFEEIKRLTK